MSKSIWYTDIYVGKTPAHITEQETWPNVMCLFFSCRQDLMQCRLASNLLYVKDDLELLTLLPLPLQSWDYRHAPPHPVYAMLGTKPIASCILCKHSTKWAISSVQFFVLFCFTPKLYFPTKLGIFALLLCWSQTAPVSLKLITLCPRLPEWHYGCVWQRFSSPNPFLFLVFSFSDAITYLSLTSDLLCSSRVSFLSRIPFLFLLK